MLNLETNLRLDLALKVAQVQMVASQFGMDSLKALIRDGIASECLTALWFYLIRSTGEESREIHGKFIIDISYDAEGGVGYAARWEPEHPSQDGDTSPVLCADFDAIIEYLRKLAGNAPDCSWASAISTSNGVEGDELCRKYGYTSTRSKSKYVDCTKPIGNPVQNTKAEGLQARIHASDALMDGKLR